MILVPWGLKVVCGTIVPPVPARRPGAGARTRRIQGRASEVWTESALSAGPRVGRSLGSVGALEQRLHVLPERLPLRALSRGQAGEGLGAAHPGEICIALPVPHFLCHEGAYLVGILVQLLAPGAHLGPQPGLSLTAQARAFLFAESPRVLAPAAAGEGRHTGGAVAVLLLQVVG